MDQVISGVQLPVRRPAAWIAGAPYAVIAGGGALVDWLSSEHPAAMPVWAPWQFSWPEYAATVLILYWFARGYRLIAPAARPALWRTIAFLAGVAATYAVLQTRFDYIAQHMFFLNRIQHVVMHHIGPFLMALGGAGEAIRRGMPDPLRRVVESRPVLATLRVVQQPLLAAFLFVGLVYFWLIPPIHFRAMIDARLYAVMNWSMVLDGILFWCLVLDPRPKPPARVSYGARAALAVGVSLPQILLGSVLAFTARDIYPFYDLCGRLFPSISAVADQHIGGVVIWVPPAMMSALAVLVVVNALRLQEESHEEEDEAAAALAAAARRWT
ncbi:MAG: cytochrome c oxidase assembly protein, partial [Stellaceae bacterium]